MVSSYSMQDLLTRLYIRMGMPTRVTMLNASYDLVGVLYMYNASEKPAAETIKAKVFSFW